MATPSPAEIKRLQDAHERLIERLDATHGRRLEGVLESLEAEIERLVGEGKITPTEAINKRVTIEAAIRGTFLTWADESVRDYDNVAAGVVAMMQKLGSIEGFVAADAATVNQLKRIAFAGYEDIAARFVDTLANGLYQNTLAGRPPRETVREMRQAINGVFAKSDDAAAMALVEFVREFRDDPSRADEVADAVEQLHTIHARDRSGNNLRRYAYQQVHDGLMQFNGSFTKAKADEAGLDHFAFDGDLVRDSREFCIRHTGKVMSVDEIREIWANSSWQGKAPGDPFVVRGGYNCRHHFTPVNPDWYGDELRPDGTTTDSDLEIEDFKELNPKRAKQLNL